MTGGTGSRACCAENIQPAASARSAAGRGAGDSGGLRSGVGFATGVGCGFGAIPATACRPEAHVVPQPGTSSADHTNARGRRPTAPALRCQRRICWRGRAVGGHEEGIPADVRDARPRTLCLAVSRRAVAATHGRSEAVHADQARAGWPQKAPTASLLRRADVCGRNGPAVILSGLFSVFHVKAPP